MGTCKNRLGEADRLGEAFNEYAQSMFWSKNKNQRTNGPVNAHLRPSYHFFDVKAYVSKINLAVK